MDELHKKMYSVRVMHGHHEQTLLRQAGWAGWAWLAVLLATFFAQALALFVPFMSIKVVLVGNDIYSLPNSVRLMWESKIYVVAILIAFFSITFPFLKLAVLRLLDLLSIVIIILNYMTTFQSHRANLFGLC